MSDDRPIKRCRKKKAMHARRALPPKIDPCPVGSVGDQYKPLTDAQIEQIYQSSLRILDELGLGEAPPTLVEQALKCGSHTNDVGRLCFSPVMVEDIID